MKRNSEEILDKVTAEIRNEKVEPAVVSAAADRVWARVSAAAGEAEFQMPAVDHIEGCTDFQSLIPAYLTGSLSEARSLLLVDSGVPFRELQLQRRQQLQHRRQLQLRRPHQHRRLLLTLCSSAHRTTPFRKTAPVSQ